MTGKATMISFACTGCGRPFSVPASFAGRRAACKTCGEKVVVPSQAAPQPQALSAAPANGNGKPHPAVAPLRARETATVPAPAPDETEAPPASDPAPAHRRPAHVAIISEAQSPPSASMAVPVAQVALPAAHDTRSEASARRIAPADLAERQQSPTAAAKVPMRVRRLMVDAEQMAKAFSGTGLIRVKSTTGDPPEVYQVEYHVKGLQKGWLGRPKTRDTHLIEIQLTSEYPRLSPKCRMLTPVFHPNIDDTTICITDHWTAGERLVDLVIRIGEMLAYQAYNIKSPLNGEAAMWADLHPKKLPVDSRSLHPGEIG